MTIMAFFKTGMAIIEMSKMKKDIIMPGTKVSSEDYVESKRSREMF